MLLAVAAMLIAAAALAQSTDPKTIVREGIALFDAGKIDEAIAKYKAALALDPELAVTRYELALAYTVKQDYAKCRAVLEPVIEKSGAAMPTLYEALGNCHDGAGDRDKAIAAYRKGLEVAPDSPHIAYNLAISLTASGELDEARTLLKQDLIAIPNHVSARYALGRVFEAQAFRVPALFEYLRFLALEPDSPRGADAAARARTLLDMGVEKKGKKNINIMVNPDSRK
ncbi:MAG TPA: tetratricopeptide repeat protein, partial [Thermoanaerobaculia bacterium]|nr:tetratricopeptide repeat protein [Thermoanaerobaculia bacterium]